MYWHPISTAPRDRMLLLTAGRRITVGKFDVYVQPDDIVDEKQYRVAERLYGASYMPITPMMPNPRAGKRDEIWHCCGMALIDLEYDPDPLSDDHHGDRIEATMWAEFVLPEVAHG